MPDKIFKNERGDEFMLTSSGKLLVITADDRKEMDEIEKDFNKDPNLVKMRIDEAKRKYDNEIIAAVMKNHKKATEKGE